ncbi:hypothetical protein Bbelb_137370 [Branchiostoma belcheri]|nr:hypothetical protein Bbelb_137370 [Branchiostoma belcheri]
MKRSIRDLHVCFLGNGPIAYSVTDIKYQMDCGEPNRQNSQQALLNEEVQAVKYWPDCCFEHLSTAANLLKDHHLDEAQSERQFSGAIGKKWEWRGLSVQVSLLESSSSTGCDKQDKCYVCVCRVTLGNLVYSFNVLKKFHSIFYGRDTCEHSEWTTTSHPILKTANLFSRVTADGIRTLNLLSS